MTPEPVTIVFAAKGIYARRERLSYEKIKEQIFAVAGGSAVLGVFGAAHCGSGAVYGPGNQFPHGGSLGGALGGRVGWRSGAACDGPQGG